MQSEIASDEEDQKKMHRAQARARGKVRSERGRRGRRFNPYKARAAVPAETMSWQAFQALQARQQPAQQQQQQQQQQRPGVCFLCGQAGHWKVDCPTNKRNYKLSTHLVSQSQSTDSSEKSCPPSTQMSCTSHVLAM